MAEVGCLNDGNFQNLQVNSKIIHDKVKKNNKVIGIGETGLDFFYKHSDKKIKDYIHKSCSADPDISIKEILQTAADTNFKPPSIPSSVVDSQ